MEKRSRGWVFAAVGGMVAGLAGCGSATQDGAVPTTVPADPAMQSAEEKNHCASGEPHHCASKDGKHVCGSMSGDAHGGAMPAQVAAPDVAAADAGAPSSSPADGGAAPAATGGASTDAGAAPKAPAHIHSDGKPHQH
jgi:hypothetical protein